MGKIKLTCNACIAFDWIGMSGKKGCDLGFRTLNTGTPLQLPNEPCYNPLTYPEHKAASYKRISDMKNMKEFQQKELPNG